MTDSSPSWFTFPPDHTPKLYYTISFALNVALKRVLDNSVSVLLIKILQALSPNLLLPPPAKAGCQLDNTDAEYGPFTNPGSWRKAPPPPFPQTGI